MASIRAREWAGWLFTVGMILLGRTNFTNLDSSLKLLCSLYGTPSMEMKIQSKQLKIRFDRNSLVKNIMKIVYCISCPISKMSSNVLSEVPNKLKLTNGQSHLGTLSATFSYPEQWTWKTTNCSKQDIFIRNFIGQSKAYMWLWCKKNTYCFI